MLLAWENLAQIYHYNHFERNNSKTLNDSHHRASRSFHTVLRNFEEHVGWTKISRVFRKAKKLPCLYVGINIIVSSCTTKKNLQKVVDYNINRRVTNTIHRLHETQFRKIANAASEGGRERRVVLETNRRKQEASRGNNGAKHENRGLAKRLPVRVTCGIWASMRARWRRSGDERPSSFLAEIYSDNRVAVGETLWKNSFPGLFIRREASDASAQSSVA